MTKRPGTNSEPAWSQDGRKIAFASGHVGGSADIYVMNADGKRLRRLTRGCENPAWSPNGRKIALQSVSFPEIVTVNADGSGPNSLTNTSPAVTDAQPDWSPDGRQIAFATNRDDLGTGVNAEIYVMNAAGSGLRRVTNSPETDSHPAWSPNGRKIAFNSAGPADEPEIDTVNVDGTGRTVLTQNASGPAWQPVRRRAK